MLIVASATVSLLLVGVLAMRTTPGRSTRSDDALVATTAAVADAGLATAATDQFTSRLLTSADSSSLRNAAAVLADAIARTLTSLTATSPTTIVATANVPTTNAPMTSVDASAASSATSAAVTTPATSFVALVTPLAPGGLGITTEAAVRGATGPIAARLPSGAEVSAEVLAAGSGVAVVLLDTDSTSEELVEIAKHPADDDKLVVMADGQAYTIDPEALAALDVPEAAPVLDEDGGLVGLYTTGPAGGEIMPVASIPELPPTSPPMSPPSSEDASGSSVAEPPAPESTEPVTTAEPPPSEPPSSSVPTSEQPTDSSEPAPTDTSEPAAPESTVASTTPSTG